MVTSPTLSVLSAHFRSISKTSLLLTAAVCGAVALAAPAVAADFTPNTLVVMRVGTTNVGGTNGIDLLEYDVSGVSPSLLQTINLPVTGPDAISLPDITNHDRHLHLSADGKFLSFAAYGVVPNATDPSTQSSSVVNRVVGLVNGSGSVDLSTKLATTYDIGNSPTFLPDSIRGAYTTDGTKIWLAGDNASDSSTTGGLRYLTAGSTTSVNLSRTQSNGGSPQADNVRDVRIFNGQLYDSSGSGSSIGKAVLKVGTGMPESGSQPITALSAQSASSFYFLDANPSIAGLDTLYAVGGATLLKYNFDGTNWLARGSVSAASTDFDQITAVLNLDGSATVFAGATGAVYKFNDATPFSASSLAGSIGSPYITPGAGFTLGGLDFSPSAAVPEPASLSVLALGGAALLLRRRSAKSK